MKRHLLPLQLVFGLLLFAAGLLAQPANDNCTNAIPIGLTNNLTFSTLDATTDGPNHPNNCVSTGTTGDSLGNDIWYTFTSNYDGYALFTLCGTADFDSKIAVYGPGFSCPPTDAQIIACNEDGNGCANSTSKITFEVLTDETYLLRLGGWVEDSIIHSGTGTFSLEEFIPQPGPPNDWCAQAIELILDANDSINVAFTSLNANTDGPLQPNVPYYCFDEDETTVFQDIWYKWTATFDGWVEWSNCGTSDFDSRVSIYEDQPCPPDPTAIVGCSDDGLYPNGQNCDGFTSRAFFPVQTGKEYLIHFGGWSDGDAGTGTFTFKKIPTPPLPPNDICAESDSAFVMTALQADEFEFLFEGTTVNGSPDGVASPTCLPTGEFSDVWYTFNSGTNTEIELRFNTVTFGASFIIDLFQTDCQTPVDPLLIDLCLLSSDFLPNSAFNETISGFPGTPTDYLLRVATKITDTSPGEFFFQLVGTPYNSIETTNLSEFQFAPNPVSGNANVRFTLTEQAEVSASIENVLGQQVLRQSFGEMQGEQSLDLLLGELESGVYFLRIGAGNSFRSIKFVKE